MSPKLTRRLILSALFLSTAGMCVSSAHAQFKIELQTCEDLKIAKAQYGVNVVETAIDLLIRGL